MCSYAQRSERLFSMAVHSAKQKSHRCFATPQFRKIEKRHARVPLVGTEELRAIETGAQQDCEAEA